MVNGLFIHCTNWQQREYRRDSFTSKLLQPKKRLHWEPPSQGCFSLCREWFLFRIVQYNGRHMARREKKRTVGIEIVSGWLCVERILSHPCSSLPVKLMVYQNRKILQEKFNLPLTCHSFVSIIRKAFVFIEPTVSVKISWHIKFEKFLFVCRITLCFYHTLNHWQDPPPPLTLKLPRSDC